MPSTTPDAITWPAASDPPDMEAIVRSTAESTQTAITARDAAKHTTAVIAGTYDAAKPLRVRTGYGTYTTASDSVAGIATGFTGCLAGFAVMQAGTGASAVSHQMIRSDTTTVDTARVLITNAAGSGLASTAVALAWIAVGQ
jgi:hypothetical protein